MSGLESLFFLMISFATRKISCFLTHSLKQKLEHYSKHSFTFPRRKAKAHLELNLAKDVKGKKKGFFKCINININKIIQCSTFVM